VRIGVTDPEWPESGFCQVVVEPEGLLSSARCVAAAAVRLSWSSR
jgi:hypothetical protein